MEATPYVGECLFRPASFKPGAVSLAESRNQRRIDIRITITRSENGARGRYTARITGEKDAGELTYTRSGENTLIADHTVVPNALRKRGIATALVERLVADARMEGFGIVPSCPFVQAWFDRNPDASDLLAEQPPAR